LRCRAARQTAQQWDGHIPRAVRAELDELARELREVPPSTRELDLLEEVDDERDRLNRLGVARRRDGLLRIRESIARLRAMASRSTMIDAAPREACRSCGFSRALLSRIDGSIWVPEILSTTGPESEPGDFPDYLRAAEIPLEHMLIETEIVRRNRPFLVTDARADERTHEDIIQASGAHSYTATPIVPARRAIGFLHCDRLGQEQPVTEEDRDNLWVFADQLALLLDSTALTERLADFEAQARRTMDDALTEIAALRTAGLTVSEEPPGVVTPTTDQAAAIPTSRLLLALTERERQVLALMATGATNLDIAESLVVGEGTVKTHVRHILRKLRVANRSEAVARYLQAARQQPRPL
jgi:DNA-binding CsgD family transcriptional regulator